MAFIVFTGQSNAGGYGMGAWTLSQPWTVDPKTLIWDRAQKTWVPMKPGENTGYGEFSQAWAAEVAFARDFRAQFPDEILYIVKEAHGGTGLAQDTELWRADWSPRSDAELFDGATRLIAEASASLGGKKPDAVFWGQGERDASEADDAQAYAANLREFLSAIRAEWMADAAGKVGIFQIGVNWPFANEVRLAQATVDQGDGGLLSVDTRDFALQSDAAHYAASAHDAIGHAYFSMFTAWRGGGAGSTAFLSPAFQNIVRSDAWSAANRALAEELTNGINAGTTTQAAAVARIVDWGDATTSVATLAYQFFTGKVPDGGGVDYLVSPSGPNPNNLNSPYYQSFNLENRYINFAVNLGREGEGAGWFQSEYGGLSLFDATKKAYGVIFGASPADAKVSALLSGGRDLYFEAYGRDGLSGQGTKAAMVGWLLAEAAKADIGMYARANEAFLTDLADGAAFSVDLVGVYGKPEYNYDG